MELALPTTATYVAQMRWLLGEVVMGETSKKREREGRVGENETDCDCGRSVCVVRSGAVLVVFGGGARWSYE